MFYIIDISDSAGVFSSTITLYFSHSTSCSRISETNYYFSGKSLQQKWKNVRTSFSRELKRKAGAKSGSAASRKSPYVYFEQLQFLKETVVNSATRAIIDETDTVESNDKGGNVQIRSPVTKKKKKTDDDSLVEVLTQSTTIREDRDKKHESNSDRLFMLSLLEDFRRIPDHRRLSTKIELMNVIKRAQMLTAEIHNQCSCHCVSETSAAGPHYNHKYGPECSYSGQYHHGYSAQPNNGLGACSSGQNRRVYSTTVSNKQNTTTIGYNKPLSSTDSDVTTVTEHSETLD